MKSNFEKIACRLGRHRLSEDGRCQRCGYVRPLDILSLPAEAITKIGDLIRNPPKPGKILKDAAKRYQKYLCCSECQGYKFVLHEREQIIGIIGKESNYAMPGDAVVGKPDNNRWNEVRVVPRCSKCKSNTAVDDDF